jgi:tungstate transport system permease protein
MVGGNIVGQTRILTTAIALETSRGEFPLAIALGIVLLLLAFVVNVLLTLVGGAWTGPVVGARAIARPSDWRPRAS